jgi:hypothetical protein
MLSFSTGKDLAVQMAIQQASAAAETYCLRSFGVETVRQSLRFCLWRDEDIYQHYLLERYPVVEILSVGAGARPVSAGDYSLEADRLYVTSSAPWWLGRASVEYRAGYTLPSDEPGATWTLPADIERAVILLAGSSLSVAGRDPMVKASEVEGIGRREYYVQGAKASLPHPEAESILDGHKAAGLS